VIQAGDWARVPVGMGRCKEFTRTRIAATDDWGHPVKLRRDGLRSRFRPGERLRLLRGKKPFAISEYQDIKRSEMIYGGAYTTR
jgi:hypothetical protein